MLKELTKSLYGIICLLKRDHDYLDEVIIDEHHSRNYCKCGKFLEFDWSLVGGYSRAMNHIDQIVQESGKN